MNRLLALCWMGLPACGGLLPLGDYDVEPEDTADTGLIDGTGGFDPGTDLDTGGTTGGSAPNLMSISAADLGSHISVSFTATDADDDMGGGAFELTVNGATTAYDIPGSLNTWSVSSGTGTIRIPTPSTGSGSTGCGGGSSTVSIRGLVEDRTGERSVQKSTSVQVSSGGGGGLSTNEVGDGFFDQYAAGVLAPPCTLTGNMADRGEGYGYDEQDVDAIAFSVSSPGTGVDLSWSGTGDYDVWVFDDAGYLTFGLTEGSTFLALGSGINGGNTPESVAVPLAPGTNYVVLVRGWSGPGGNYSLVIR